MILEADATVAGFNVKTPDPLLAADRQEEELR